MDTLSRTIRAPVRRPATGEKTPLATVAIWGRQSGQRMFAITFPPKPGTVWTRFLPSNLRSTQWALRPVSSRAAGRAAMDALTRAAPSRMTSGPYFAASSAMARARSGEPPCSRRRSSSRRTTEGPQSKTRFATASGPMTSASSGKPERSDSWRPLPSSSKLTASGLPPLCAMKTQIAPASLVAFIGLLRARP